MCGGGPTLFQTLGILYHLETTGFYKLENIETIYGTSAGAILGLCIALKFDWETINDYLIKRPWQDVFPIKVQNILDSYTKKGIYDSKNIEKCFKPLFDAKDIPIDINLYDFYKITNVELHFFAFEINEYKIIDISHLTYPNLSVMNAIQMTTAIPILVSPVCVDNKCYVDGGFICNYPLNYCIESGKQPDEILGLKNKYSDNNNNVTSDTNLLQFLFIFFNKAIFCLNIDNKQPAIKNEIICDVSHMTFESIKYAAIDSLKRKELFESGVSCAKTFLSKSTSNSNDNCSNEEKDNSEKNKEIDIDKELENSIQELN